MKILTLTLFDIPGPESVKPGNSLQLYCEAEQEETVGSLIGIGNYQQISFDS